MRAPLKTVLLATGLLAGAAVAAAALAFSAGTVDVKVAEKKPGGARIHLLVPAAVVPVGLRFLPESERRKLAGELGPYLPAVRAASLELARTEDFSLVEVQSREERVSIRIEGGSLRMDVESPEESVHLSVPLELVARLAAELQPLAPERAALLEGR